MNKVDLARIPNEDLVIVYLGCWGRVGHYYWVNGRDRGALDSPKNCPWRQLDSKKMIDSDIQGEAYIHHKDGWTALAIGDRSVDSRPNSRAVFAVNVPDLDAEEVEFLARKFKMYSHIFDRIGKIKVTKEFNDV